MLPPNDDDFEEGSDEQIDNYLEYNGLSNQVPVLPCVIVILVLIGYGIYQYFTH